MHRSLPWRMKLLCLALCLAVQPAVAITILIDFKYDLPSNGGSNFFASGNPQGTTGGAQATAALNAAASFYSAILTDTFDAITIPLPYPSNFPNSTSKKTWSWQQRFQHPSDSNPNEVQVPNPTVNADQYVVYAGAQSLPGDTAGKGGPGGWFRPAPAESGSGGYTQGDANSIAAITANFDQLIAKRGEPSGFAGWGGTISFDNDGSTPWFFNHLGTPSGNVTDFYSVAIHELGHALGFGASTAWNALVSGSSFVGLKSENQNNGNAVPLSPDLGHWVAGKTSVVYGTATPQEAAMDLDLQNGTRKKLTALDAAGLEDIGWSLGPPPSLNGDYNSNGVVDASDYTAWRKRLNQNVTLPNDTTPGTVSAVDYTVWRTNFGKVASGSGSGTLLAVAEIPEPTSGIFAMTLALCVSLGRSTLRR
jgi:hypothetical protein